MQTTMHGVTSVKYNHRTIERKEEGNITYTNIRIENDKGQVFDIQLHGTDHENLTPKFTTKDL